MTKRDQVYSIIDLFAGPGGLGEGFAELYNNNSESAFRSVASIERDENAYQTLLLRHFNRSFRREDVPDDYYDYLASRITREELIANNEKHWEEAKTTALKISLGDECHRNVKGIIKKRLSDKNKWALIGGPPCQAYSLVGRSRMMGDPGFEGDKRHFLYKEYLRIIIDHRPPVFVMENVKGLLSARINGKLVIDKIVSDLSSPVKAIGGNTNELKYKLFSLSHPGEIEAEIEPKAFIVKSDEYGVPQARHRMFILGIRSDIKAEPSILEKKASPTVEEIISSLPEIRSGVSRQQDSVELWKNILASTKDSNWITSNKNNDKKLKKVVTSTLRKIQISNLEKSSKMYEPPEIMRSWYHDDRMTAITSHEARSHMESDLRRYLFVSSYGMALNVSPKLADFPEALLPAHKNVGIGRDGKMFPDRFRVQLKSSVSKTVTSHISKDGHYFIHYDPAQCRSLTVREAARLQTFPDNYHFEGPRTSQYHQVGNAVPPYLAVQIAEIVREVLDQMPGER